MNYPFVNICYNLKLESIWLAETRPCWGVYHMRLRIEVVSNVNFRHWQGFPMDKNKNIYFQWTTFKETGEKIYI